MENASKALGMAAGVLLGVMIMALVAYFFSNLGKVQVAEDETTFSEQTQKFNMEYEAYNKSGMYGVDIISCLNKAQSNNRKYVDQDAFYVGLTGTTGDYKNYMTNSNEGYNDSKNYLNGSADYTIDIIVQFNSPLKERVTVTHVDSKGLESEYRKGEKLDGILVSNNVKNIYFWGDIIDRYYKYDWSKLDGVYTSIPFDPDPTLNKLIEGGYSEEKEITTPITLADGSQVNPIAGGKKYSLIFDKSKTLEVLLRLCNSNNMRIQVLNPRKNDFSWRSLTWDTALYDMKKRKFKCSEINYSDKTGRVKQMVFEELVY